MDKLKRLQLIQRSLGLRHKLKVHESMKQPETHEDVAVMLITKWEYEDELRAIEEILAETRQENVQKKKAVLLKAPVELPAPVEVSDENTEIEDKSQSPARKKSRR